LGNLLESPEYSIRKTPYSDFKLSTGFMEAAFIAWKLIVNSVITNGPRIAMTNIHQIVSEKKAEVATQDFGGNFSFYSRVNI
jgi:hypothetical protein